MFLNELNVLEKKAFLELAHLVAISNGELADEESSLLEAYEKEMEIGLNIEDLENLSLEEIVPMFSSEHSKRIAFIESIALALADGEYQEADLINKIREAFGFSKEYYESVKKWIASFNSIYAQGMELKNGSTVSL